MTKVSFNVVQPVLETGAVAKIFLDTGMSADEAEYYAGQVVGGCAFELDAPDTVVVERMIAGLENLKVNMDIDRDAVQ